MRGPLLGEPVGLFLPGRLFVSGTCGLKTAARVSLFWCAFCGGAPEPLAIVIERVPLGLTSVTDSESCAATTHPSGSGTATAALEADVGDEMVGCGDGTGLGEPAGDGLDSSLTSLAAWLLACPKPTASTVPTPA